ncbi:hypothetical protein E4U42_000532 [Claviceps africana]|uniref:MYND-type domain-containing protein n=1 Tax=Claviceps africana TaxID=83212 RepID=A0A8K0J1K3_9HYPO|nr:hypothetical protein E4U42_000532 [Claviceps africana]
MECIICKKSPPEVNIKRCAKCSVTPYCSRNCQKADWKAHRKICGKQTGGTAPAGAASSSSSSASASASANLSPPRGLQRGVAQPFTRLDKGTWLHDRPDEDVYTLLVDAYRLRVEDMYALDGEVMAGSLYDGAPDGLVGFLKFLNLVQARPGLYPPWWNADKMTECVEFAMTDSWLSLACAVEKSDIIEHYGDPRFPMQLRMFAESVYGSAPGGTSGGPMRQLMMSMEQGRFQGYTSHLDMNSAFRRP